MNPTTATQSPAHRRMLAAINDFGYEPEDLVGVDIMRPEYAYLEVE